MVNAQAVVPNERSSITTFDGILSKKPRNFIASRNKTGPTLIGAFKNSGLNLIATDRLPYERQISV